MFRFLTFGKNAIWKEKGKEEFHQVKDYQNVGWEFYKRTKFYIRLHFGYLLLLF